MRPELAGRPNLKRVNDADEGADRGPTVAGTVPNPEARPSWSAITGDDAWDGNRVSLVGAGTTPAGLAIIRLVAVPVAAAAWVPIRWFSPAG